MVHLLLGTLKDAGIETKDIVADDSVFTTLAFVTFDESGGRSFSFARKPGANTQLVWEEIDKSFHFGTLSLTDEPVRGNRRWYPQHSSEEHGAEDYVMKKPEILLDFRFLIFCGA